MKDLLKDAQWTSRIADRQEKGSKEEAIRYTIIQALSPNKELTFEGLIKATNLSRATVSKYTEKLEGEGLIEKRSKGAVVKGRGSRGKWLLTKRGSDIIKIDGLVSQVKSCKILSLAGGEEPSSKTFVLLDYIKEPESQNPYEDNRQIAEVVFSDTFMNRIFSHRLELTQDDIKEIVRIEGIFETDNEKLKEKVLEALAKRMKKIVLVEIFEPSVLLEKLKKAKEPKDVNLNECPECGCREFNLDAHEKTCKKCGLILND